MIAFSSFIIRETGGLDFSLFRYFSFCVFLIDNNPPVNVSPRTDLT